MSVAVRIENEIYEAAKKSAEAEYRTVPGQVNYWAMIGKVALENPDLPIEFIRDTLAAKKQGDFEPFEFEK